MYYKVLGENGESWHGGTGEWHKPKGSRPGKWMPEVRDIRPCERGYHLVTFEQLPRWLGPTIWVAEGRGEHIDHEDKHVFGEARLMKQLSWDLQTWKWWTLECLEAIPELNPKAVKFLAETRRYLNGEIGQKIYRDFYYFSFSSYFSYFSSYFSSYFHSFSDRRLWIEGNKDRLAVRLGIER